LTFRDSPALEAPDAEPRAAPRDARREREARRATIFAQSLAMAGRSRPTPRAFGPRTYFAGFGATPPPPPVSAAARTPRAVGALFDAAVSKSGARASCAA
jgi:hypothetical protein